MVELLLDKGEADPNAEGGGQGESAGVVYLPLELAVEKKNVYIGMSCAIYADLLPASAFTDGVLYLM